MFARVLLVEDEEWIRKGLVKSILWDALGLSLVGEAANGSEALSFFAHEHIDIVITDMRMPACDGRELLIQMEERHLNCEVIVLSEYSDFAYMRQAIHAKVFDYLLKPVDTSVLNACLKRLVEKRAFHQNREKNAKDAALAALLAELERGALPAGALDRIPENVRVFYTERPVFLACVKVLELSIRDSYSFIEKVLGASIREGEEYALTPLQSSEGLIALLFTAQSDPRECGFAFIALLNRILKTAQQSGRLIRIGALRARLSVDHLQSALHLVAQAAQTLHRGENELIFAEQVTAPDSAPFALPVGERHLQGIFENPNRAKIDHLLQQLLLWARSFEFLPVSSLQKALIDLSLSLEKSCQRSGFAVNISRELGQSYLEPIHAVQSLPAMERYLNHMFTALTQTLEQKQVFTSAQVVDEIVAQLQTRYAENISLIEYSERFHLNYIYLSRLFKSHTGITFTEYLQRVRMEHAKALMEQGLLSTREIATLCGYPNPYYFISAYNKYFGKE